MKKPKLVSEEQVGKPDSSRRSANALSSAMLYQAFHRDYIDRFNATRRIEWIINGALWGGIIVAGGYLAGRVNAAEWPTLTPLLTALRIGLTHFFFWMIPIQASENRDMKVARQYRVLAHLALNGEEDLVPSDEAEREAFFEQNARRFPRADDTVIYGLWPRGYIWSVIESATTFILVLAVSLFLRYVPVLIKI